MTSAGKNKKWLGYSLYVILVTIVLLYYLFPAQAVEEFVDSSISRIDPGLGFKADRLRPSVPAGLGITGGRIYLKNIPAAAVFKADNLYVGPRFLKLAGGEYNFNFSGTAYGGDLQGFLHAGDGNGKTLDTELTFNEFDLSAYEFLAAQLKHNVTGQISGDITFSRDAANPGGNGKADLHVKGGQLQFQEALFGISGVDLQNIDMQLEFRNGEIMVVKAELAGAEVKAFMSGAIQLQADAKLSQLDLKGNLEPLVEFYKKYPEIRELLKSMRKRVRRGQYQFIITGTLGEPKFRLL